MAQHIIPEHEKDQHIQEPECICEPEFKMDHETGEMVWIHQILNWDKLVDDLIKI